MPQVCYMDIYLSFLIRLSCWYCDMLVAWWSACFLEREEYRWSLHHLSGRVNLQCQQANTRRCGITLFIFLYSQILTNVMESEKQTADRDAPLQQWTSCKLIIDPALTKGLYKVYRYDGLRFNLPVSVFLYLSYIINLIDGRYSWSSAKILRQMFWVVTVLFSINRWRICR